MTAALKPDERDLRDEDDFTHYFNACGRLTTENGALKAEIELLRAAEDHDLRCKKSLRAEVRRLQTLLAASESLKSGYLDENARLRACRTELDYVFEYYTHGLRPLDLRDWYNRACAAIKDTKP